MGFESSPAQEPSQEQAPSVENKKRILKKALNRVAAFMLAGMMIEASGAGELIRVNLGLASGEKIERVEKEKRVRKIFGEKELDAMVKASRQEKKQEVGANKEIDIDSLPSADGELSSEEIKDYLKSFPKHWVDGEVSSIKFRDRDGVSGDAEATFFNFEDRTDGPIEFYKISREENIPALTYALAHEIAHANDWLSDNELSYEERLDLVLNISERVAASDRYKSSYVESITESSTLAGEDERGVLGRKTREYWAEISAVYALEPTALDIKDFSIVDAVVKKNDSDFKPGSTKEKRAEVIKRTVKDPDTLKIYGFAKN